MGGCGLPRFNAADLKKMRNPQGSDLVLFLETKYTETHPNGEGKGFPIKEAWMIGFLSQMTEHDIDLATK